MVLWKAFARRRTIFLIISYSNEVGIGSASELSDGHFMIVSCTPSLREARTQPMTDRESANASGNWCFGIYFCRHIFEGGGGGVWGGGGVLSHNIGSLSENVSTCINV